MSDRKITERFWKSLFELTDQMRDRTVVLKEFSKSVNITIQQLRLIRAVERITRLQSPEGVMLKTVADALEVTPAAVSGMVDALVKRGFLIRNQSEADRRSVRILLSPGFRQRIHAVEEFFDDVSEKLEPVLGAEKFLELTQSLEQLRDHFAERVIHSVEK